MRNRAALGCVISALPLTRRPTLLVGTAVICSAILLVLTQHFDSHGAERLTDVSTTNRVCPWTMALQSFARSPLVGHGWIHMPGGSTANALLLGFAAGMIDHLPVLAAREKSVARRRHDHLAQRLRAQQFPPTATGNGTPLPVGRMH